MLSLIYTLFKKLMLALRAFHEFIQNPSTVSGWMPYFGFLTSSSKRTTSLSLSLSSQPMAAKTDTVAGPRTEIGNDSEVNEWSELLTNEQAKKNFE